MDCALYTHHPLSLINKRLSFLCIWTDTCLTAQTIFPGGFPMPSGPWQRSLSSQNPTDPFDWKEQMALISSLLCWIHRLQEYPNSVRIDLKACHVHGPPYHKASPALVGWMTPCLQPKTQPVAQRGTIGSHSCCSTLTFFVQGIASEAIPIGWIAPNRLRSEAIKEISGGFQKAADRVQAVKQTGDSSHPDQKTWTTLWHVSSKPNRMKVHCCLINLVWFQRIVFGWCIVCGLVQRGQFL